MTKNVIITGVSGMDGSNLADYLLANTDHRVFGVVRRLSVPNHGNLFNALRNPRFKLVSADLGDQVSIDNLVKEIQPDYFINLAAQSFVAESWNTPVNTFDINTLGVLRCLEAIRKIYPNCRFYSAGSSEEWGDVLYSPQDINHPIRPRSPYGASKAGARHIVKVYRESYNLYALHGILFNHEGLRRGQEFVTRKITKGVARIYHGIKHSMETNSPFVFSPIELGNLDAKRDWSDSEDFVEGIWRIMNQEVHRPGLKESQIYYKGGSILSPYCIDTKNREALSPLLKEYVLASGETHTVREFVEKAFAAASIEGEWAWKDQSDPSSHFYRLAPGIARTLRFANDHPLVVINPQFYRPAEVDLLIGDSTPAREELGWLPKIPFDQLVHRMVANDIKNHARV